MITWVETQRRLAHDKQRILDNLTSNDIKNPMLMILNTSYQCIYLYRLSHYLYLRNNSSLSKFFWYVNLTLNGIEISPDSDIQEGALLHKPLGVIISGIIGKNCTIGSNVVIASDVFSMDTEVGSVLPVLGDNVRIENAAIISNGVNIGDDVTIGPRCSVKKDLQSGSSVWLNSLLIRSKANSV